ncbi:MAG TPA: asparagine synthase-related protein [Phycisphaeraceae bacterium]
MDLHRLCDILGPEPPAAEASIQAHEPLQRLDAGPMGVAACAGGGVGDHRPVWVGLARWSHCAVAFRGRLYNQAELAGWLGGDAPPVEEGPAALLAALYRRYGEDFPQRIAGRFTFALYDAADHRLLLGRDHLGAETLYYHDDGRRVVFSSQIAALLRAANLEASLDPTTLVRFLMFHYEAGTRTMFRGVRKLPPGHVLIAGLHATRPHRYWRLSFANPHPDNPRQIAQALWQELERAVQIRVPTSGPAPAVFLSGGLDSSTVLGLMRAGWMGSIHTYAYRCRGESFDESHYARLMAHSVGAEHTEVEYRPQDVLLMEQVVQQMQEPLCEIGITVATYLLGRAAAGREALVLTGDGGDELFAGHPVYEAEQVARFIDRLPPAVCRPLMSLLLQLPDSRRKKNLLVKLKRFAQNISLPKEMLANRWRTYYTPALLAQALTPQLLDAVDLDDLLEDFFRIHAEADGPDPLSHALYADYQTIIEFYLRRSELIRCFGLEVRHPLMDRQLVEFCAAIPSRLKVRRWFDVKYILRRTMDGFLPHAITHRRDKLGHSVPMKNWLRQDDTVRSFVLDYLSTATLRRRGLIQPRFVEQQIQDHLSMRANNSHRLWTLAVLEMWLRRHLDAAPAPASRWSGRGQPSQSGKS